MTTLSRRGVAVGLTASSLLAPRLLRADGTYPARPIRLIVPYAPGGSADFTARVVSPKMGDLLKQTFVVENRPGANGTVGADVVANSAPDGYTVLLVPREIAINPALYKTMPFDTLSAFAWIGVANEGHFVLVVNPSVPAKTFAELVALAKAKPGALAYGSIGIGSIAHLNTEALKQRLGIDLQHVPYKGAGPAIAATLAGEVPMTIAAIPGAINFIADGRLRALAVGAPKRLPQLPDVPTLGELDAGVDTFATTSFGFAAPHGTPADIVETLGKAMRDAIADADIVRKLDGNGLIPVGSTPTAMAASVASDMQRFGRLVQSIGLKAE